MTSPEPQVSVVIPAYNAQKTIAPLLESLLRIDHASYEVIVVDDGSHDWTRDIARRYPVRLLERPHRGASAARDAGLRAASAELVAYADSDVTVTRSWLRNLVEPFSDPSVAATTGQTIFLRNEKCTSWMRSLDIARRNARRRVFTRLANGPNSAFRKSVLLEVGGFDPRWYHAEDTEVSYRIWQSGHRIRYVPEAIVHHTPEDDWRHYVRKRYRDAKAFTRMLRRYARPAVMEDDYVTPGMKIQPPLFLGISVLAVLAMALWFTNLAPPLFVALAVLVASGVLLNVPESLAAARESRRPSFFFKGIALNLLRGFAWGAGLGVGTVRQLMPTAPER